MIETPTEPFFSKGMLITEIHVKSSDAFHFTEHFINEVSWCIQETARPR